MQKKKSKPKLALLQTTLKPDMARRFYASQELQLHGNVSAALRAILDKYLTTTGEGQEKNDSQKTYPIAG